jgi:hypothetical protein
MNQLVPFNTPNASALVTVAGARAQTRFWEFFVSNIRNPHTRRAYARAFRHGGEAAERDAIHGCASPP